MPFMQDAYRALLRNNKLYVAFIFTGALVGERLVHNTTGALWEMNNQGKLYKHLEGTVIGGASDEDDEEPRTRLGLAPDLERLVGTRRSLTLAVVASP
eukprot:CAMPEP_0198461898 /NCGR_PEP_ID=MMETSP1456-20131121/533_1 /TAXON_ID=1461544 ORGANISM="Unidentified sp., Strain RCC1871" /NCGR_SAMPLE_ID=MMETSP1456 /ASSEMBLY_ACC=CAM_ASM_001119 /LENGTH=97 /DNA_ID=CAMNT_0044187011 /DNA_START=76 /DNA_END=367 /DNA_ORIENTATION=-